jgi:hypothetical protein
VGRAALTTAVVLGLLAFLATGSAAAAAVMLVGSAACAAAVVRYVRRREPAGATVPGGALWAGLATVRVLDLLGCPLLDTVTVHRPGRAERHPARGAPGELVIDRDGLTWTANWAATLGGVRGSFALPWASIVRAQAAAFPAPTPGSGAIALSFADSTKLDMAFAGTYPSFRAALTRLPRPLPGLG